MSMQDRPMRRLRTALILIAVLCVAAATPLAAQQVQDSAHVAVTTAAPASSTATALPGPRVSAPQFQSYEPTLTRSSASDHSSLAAAGSHTIVISTLALVLIVIIVVLLVVH